MLLGLTPLQHVLAFVVVLLGSAIQGAFGFGSNLFAAPLLVLIDPGLVPGPIILTSALLNILIIRRERAPHAWREMRWPIVGQFPDAFMGAAVLSIIAKDHLAVFFASMILLAVALSVSGLHPKRTNRSLTVAGFVSAFMGTSVGVGGPPIAMFFQNATGPEIRASLSRFFAVGGWLSLAMLTAFGQFDLDDVLAGVLLMPGTLVGYAVSSQLLHRVDPRHVRIAVLALSTASALVALVHAFTA